VKNVKYFHAERRPSPRTCHLTWSAITYFVWKERFGFACCLWQGCSIRRSRSNSRPQRYCG